MAISGTYAFNPDISEIVEEAYERAGLEMRSGYDLRTARRSLNILTLEWQNRGINLWTVDESTIDETEAGVSLGSDKFLKKGTASYNLDTGTISLLGIVLRTDAGSATSQMDYRLARIAQPTYETIPNKLTQARPLQYYFQRREILGAADDGSAQKDRISLWPVPDADSKYQIIYWRLKRISDTGDIASNTMQVPGRFIPALIAGLAYHLSMKRAEAAPRSQMLKQVYDEEFRMAAEEDREKASVRFVPHIQGY